MQAEQAQKQGEQGQLDDKKEGDDIEKLQQEEKKEKVTADDMMRKWKAPLLSTGSRQPFIVEQGQLSSINMAPHDLKDQEPEIMEESWTLTKNTTSFTDETGAILSPTRETPAGLKSPANGGSMGTGQPVSFAAGCTQKDPSLCT